VLRYEERTHFRCYALEADPSTSTNIHVLGALRQAGLDIQSSPVQKILRFLSRTRTETGTWFDKWHTSPYYPTSHAIINCAGYADDLVIRAVRWILETQNADGSWGHSLPTAEETAYSLQALAVWRRNGHSTPDDALQRGASWLGRHASPPYPSLWIGKCLYCPQVPVRSAILSALALASEVEPS
jgi:halimadienyl-diphosphate synthase